MLNMWVSLPPILQLPHENATMHKRCIVTTISQALKPSSPQALELCSVQTSLQVSGFSLLADGISSQANPIGHPSAFFL